MNLARALGIRWLVFSQCSKIRELIRRKALPIRRKALPLTRGLVIGVVLSSALILAACYHEKSTSSNQTSTTAQSQANQQATSEPEKGAIVITPQMRDLLQHK